MLDGVSLDQLRTFIAAVDEGSFSAAARKLNRVQSAISGWVAGLEDQIGVVLFDRSGRFPKLTPQGALLLTDARNIVSGVDTLKARAKLMASGLEPELSVVVDVFFPTSAITAVVKEFAVRFPLTRLKMFVEGLGAGYEPIMDGRCSLGILASLPVNFPTLTGERIGEFSLVMVAAIDHPLSRLNGKIPKRELVKHIQLVLTDRSEMLSGQDYGVMSPLTWRLADLSTKYAFLKDGVGWGSMPLHMVEQDLATGTLVRLDMEGIPREGVKIDFSAVHATNRLPGPAGRWLIDRIKISPIG
ncbi:LysR family transcriptional regulator [Pseudomonas sp. Irchel 3H7]|uniref:LysR family transcriptional regulator n=1 Tax=Pseudomonas sp. Irchel 3H7 TaxID=2009042 RepID=UPI000BA3FF5F|nr:LysR family transcriptional regulator [Pseudomonas sp. Irchel 3H7]